MVMERRTEPTVVGLAPTAKAIREAGLGLNPSPDGQMIRIPIPELTTERRNELAKLAHKYAEQGKVAVRNVRRDGMDSLKKAEKDHKISEDEHRQKADELHARFRDPSSDFLTLVNLWNYLEEQSQELGSSAFRRKCRDEFINFMRFREWQDVFRHYVFEAGETTAAHVPEGARGALAPMDEARVAALRERLLQRLKR